jgi:NAD(P)-dependent dehydrogenase (short-subunit alcohol dehydrogenase family)
MRPDVSSSKALVFGGTGTVGGAVLEGLSRAGVPTVFTYRTQREKAEALARRHSQRGVAVDLTKPAELRSLLRSLAREGHAADIFVHCAAASRSLPLAEIGDDDFLAVNLVNAHSAFVACQELTAAMVARGSGHVVLVGAIDRAQSLPLPVHYAASQGALSAMAMSLGKELGPHGVRVNLLALGLLEGGLSREISPKLVEDYKSFSALRRLGTAQEAARAALFLALENTYMNGRVLAVNGGL